ncbi:MAG: Crp/Fnr family transcriptional regulator [Candidatus Dormiibacterota bacterium]
MSVLYAPSRNLLLQALPPVERDTLLAHLRPTALSAKTVLFEPGEAIEKVHFPLDGVISLATPSADGSVEVATIGNEAIVGVPLITAGLSCVRAVSPVGAQTLQLGAATFLAEIERLDAFRRLVERYLLALFAQISQLAACNRLHATEQRLSRWLLMTHDRVATDTFPVGEGPSLSLPNCCFRRRGAPRRRSRYSDDVAEDLSGTV